ncbi:MAG TPA: hypothetical protein DIU00_02555 [Phycisphaerales bacterium]|nr:hypothetical protein [Phycisphaerales bacterium]
MASRNFINAADFLTHIARETASIAAPGSIYGRVLVGERIKQKVTEFFTDSELFPMIDLWNCSVNTEYYQNWHKLQVNGLSNVIGEHIKQLHNHTPRISFPIAAKLLDTFMHQLMKYERFR